MTKLKFLKYLSIATAYVLLIAVIAPALISTKSTLAFALGVGSLVTAFIIVPAFYIINYFNQK